MRDKVTVFFIIYLLNCIFMAFIPAITAAAIGALGSIGSSIFGGSSSAKSTRNTNATNLAIARETNNTNIKLANAQNQWNLEQWQRENEYNSPSAQMARLRAAGINPYLAEGVTTGTADSLNSADLSVAQNPPTLQPYDYMPLANGVSSALSSYTAGLNQAAQTEGMNLQNQLSAATMAMRISQLAKDNNFKDLENSAKGLALQQTLDTYSDVVKQVRAETVRRQLTNFSIQLDNESKSMDNQIKRDYGFKLAEAELEKVREERQRILMETITGYQLANSTVRLNDAQINHISAQIAQGWANIRINQQMADIAQQNANSNTLNALTNQANGVQSGLESNARISEIQAKLPQLVAEAKYYVNAYAKENQYVSPDASFAPRFIDSFGRSLNHSGFGEILNWFH